MVKTVKTFIAATLVFATFSALATEKDMTCKEFLLWKESRYKIPGGSVFMPGELSARMMVCMFGGAPNSEVLKGSTKLSKKKIN